MAPAYETPSAESSYFAPAENLAPSSYGSPAAAVAPNVPVYIPTAPTIPPTIRPAIEPILDDPVEYQNEPLPIYYGDLSNYGKSSSATVQSSSVGSGSSLYEEIALPEEAPPVVDASADFGLASAGASGYQFPSPSAPPNQPSPAPFTAFGSQNLASFSSFQSASPSPLPYYAFPSGPTPAPVDLLPSPSALAPEVAALPQYGRIPEAADDKSASDVVDLRKKTTGGESANSLEES